MSWQVLLGSKGLVKVQAILIVLKHCKLNDSKICFI